MISNFASISIEDYFTLKVCKMHLCSLCSVPTRKITRGSINVSFYAFYWSCKRKNQKECFMDPWIEKILGGYKSKVVYCRKLVFQGGVGFLIGYILDHTQPHLVDFWKKRPANFNFIWLEWNSYNSSIQICIVWSRSSIFKLKSSSA